ncbi:hypothetical protein [Paenibacillus sp. N3.4]|uniref:hypothetical protein n=1 Tax=Paenibacillus sp. N3.4 TaxID=2603222 RepID=UPI0011C941AA|nr:hypothetical protein [Paenibacillus sp. N3.4]TXK83448.1 hypothetical protein FU659_13745 [Paenibacillus sp. N3.4]
MTNEQGYHWYDLAHLIVFFDHVWFIKIVFFLFTCFVYPLSLLLNRSFGEDSTSWTNVKSIAVKILNLIEKALILCAVVFVIVQFTRYFMEK